MKTILLITTAVVLYCYSAIAQTTTIVSLDQLYKNGQYDRAISQFGHLEDSKNSETLFVLGNCYYERAAQKERQAMDKYQQALYNQMIMSLQGMYVDNSMAVYLYNLDNREVLELRLKAITLYSKSSALGNANALNKMNLINSISGNGNFSVTGGLAPAGNSGYQAPTKQKCSYCNGTGHIDGYVATYGNTDQKWCSECGKYVSAGHCHGCNTCPSCGGTGYR